jgi:hypothetical protein
MCIKRELKQGMGNVYILGKINYVLVVYMGRDVWIWMGEKSITRIV